MKKIAKVLILSSLLSSVAYADEGPTVVLPEGSYFSVGLGAADPQGMPSAQDFVDSGVASGSNPSVENRQGAARVSAGYLFTGNTFVRPGLELGASYLGSADYTTNSEGLKYNFYTVDFLGVARFSAGKLLLSLKGGIANEYIELDETDLSDSYKNTNDYLPEVGAVIGYQVSKHSLLNLSWYHTFGSDIDFSEPSSIDNAPSVNSAFFEYTYLF